MNSAIKYRADIDGLRTLAVMPVVLFHAGFLFIPGGFIGVDIFFVISGYLITKILIEEIDHNKFSIAAFYERRARRIFPALFTMLLIVFAVGFLMLTPGDLKRLGASMLASSLFLSNAYFWLTGGYFDVNAVKPLLHTWSLSVEEQYYIVFPLILIAFRNRRIRDIAIIALFASSFLFSVYQVYMGQLVPAFFLIFSRFWELLCGSILAARMLPAPVGRQADIFAGVGLVMVLIGMFVLHEHSPFPGAAALLPCLGAAAIIHSGNSTFVARILSLKPFVAIGKISYSLYLWHWPIIVFYTYYKGDSGSLTEKVGMVVVSMIVAVISYFVIETPFRKRSLMPSRRSILQASAVAIALCVTLGGALFASKGIPARYPEELRKIANAEDDTNPMRKACDNASLARISSGQLCTIGDPSLSPSFAVLGDSFGDALVPGVDAFATSHQKAGVVLTFSGCYPMLGLIDLNKGKDTTCSDRIAAAVDYIKRSSNIQDVILIGRWSSAINGSRFGSQFQDGWYVQDAESKEASYEENKKAMERSLLRTINALDGKTVSVVAYIPEQPYAGNRVLAVCRYFGRPCPPEGVEFSVYSKRQKLVHELLEKPEIKSRVRVIDYGTAICDQSSCGMIRDGVMLYADDNHPSRSAAIKFSDLFRTAFEVEASENNS